MISRYEKTRKKKFTIPAGLIEDDARRRQEAIEVAKQRETSALQRNMSLSSMYNSSTKMY